MNVIRTAGGGGGELQRMSVFFKIFTNRNFCILFPFHDVFLCRLTNKQFVFQVGIKIVDTNTPKKLLTECIASIVPTTRG